MKSALDVIQSLAQSLSDLQQHYDELRSTQSALDIQVSDIYHEIETSNFNARDGYKYAKKLQDVLRQRRIVKTEVDFTRSIVETIKPRVLVEKVAKGAVRAQSSLDSVYQYLGVKAGEPQ